MLGLHCVFALLGQPCFEDENGEQTGGAIKDATNSRMQLPSRTLSK